MSSAEFENAEDKLTKLLTNYISASTACYQLQAKRIEELIYQLQKATKFNQILHNKIIILKEEICTLKKILREKMTDLRKTAENILKEIRKTRDPNL